jgi:hypothetical protein
LIGIDQRFELDLNRGAKTEVLNCQGKQQVTRHTKSAVSRVVNGVKVASNRFGKPTALFSCDANGPVLLFMKCV